MPKHDPALVSGATAHRPGKVPEPWDFTKPIRGFVPSSFRLSHELIANDGQDVRYLRFDDPDSLTPFEEA